jgi:hypothetical protein
MASLYSCQSSKHQLVGTLCLAGVLVLHRHLEHLLTAALLLIVQQECIQLLQAYLKTRQVNTQ